MIDRKNLLKDLQKLVRELEDDLRERCEADEQVMEHLRSEWSKAKKAKRTAATFEAWRDGTGNLSGRLTEVAAAWVLACVFVRFLEENDLIAPPRLGGPGDRMQRARDERTAYAQREPLHNDAQYLEWAIGQAAELPALGDVLGDRHNPLWTLRLSPDGGKKLLQFWQQRDDETGDARWDFSDPDWDTRFLGDLYQDLSQSARKRYALLQTPEFIEAFILDRTLDPACEEFGYREVKMIDPACGSGHFLLGAFDRLFRRWAKDQPGEKPTVLAQRALDAVHGVDINPFAVGIAKFRLLVAAIRAAGVVRMADAPAFHLQLATGDSLLHGPLFERSRLRDVQRSLGNWLEDAHIFETEDGEALSEILGQQYHVVVGNPPYITPKDKALNAAYRQRYGSCSRKYALSVPFMQRLFDLAIAPDHGKASPAGFVGQITSNSFMKREFGKKLVEEYIPRWDLTLVIDMSGAYVPGHGTPTVILVGRHRAPVGDALRVVLGIRGEPSTPDDPACGLVWTAIVDQVDQAGSESEFVSVNDAARTRLAAHPWSLQGGGAIELRERIEGASLGTLGGRVDAIGFGAIMGEDDAFGAPNGSPHWRGVELSHRRQLVEGNGVRDWSVESPTSVLFPYDTAIQLRRDPKDLRWLWPVRTTLSARRDFSKRTYRECGRPWWEYHQIPTERNRTPLTITFAFVATHNHFVLDRGGKVFKQSAPVIKLPPEATEEDHLALLGLLNSSVACFWMKQVCHNKGGGGIGGGIASEDWEQFMEFTGTKLLEFPLPRKHSVSHGSSLDRAVATHVAFAPAAWVGRDSPSTWDVAESCEAFTATGCDMIALQEELDWKCYSLYRLTDEPVCVDGVPPSIKLGQRAFEIIMARKMAAGELETRWFERHGSAPITEIPEHWPEDYRLLVQRRILEIETNKSIRLIEQPEYKRRWNIEPWEKQLDQALHSWLLDRLEDQRYWPEPALQSCSRLADRVRQDDEFLRAAEVYTGRSDYDLTKLVEDLVSGEAVPFLAAQRYKPPGMRKRMLWERTWDLQREEDAIDARVELPEDDPQHLSPDAAKALKQSEIGDIPVPPKYASKDFRKATYWRLRGKLDVPKERFVSFPGAERDVDSTRVVTWAGFDHLQQATALATYVTERKESDGWTKEKLVPLLAGVLELVPWLKQWHNEIDPAFRERMGDYLATFVDTEAAALGVTLEDLRSWRPPEKTRGRRKSKKKGT